MTMMQQEFVNVESPVIKAEGSLSSMDSNDSAHQAVVSKSLKSSFRLSNPNPGRTSSLRDSDRTFVVKRVTSSASSTSNTASVLSASHSHSRDVEDREEPIFLDEMSQILLEGIHHEGQKQILKALGRLADVCSQSHELREQACQMGAPAAMVALMKKWTVRKSIQAACFRVLIALTVGQDCINVRKTLWMVGGMEQIIQAMAQFPESRSVQFFGCNALLSLLPSGSEEENQKIRKWMGRRFLREYKGVKTVIAAMVQFEEDRGMQEAGCSVLLKLATFMHSGQDRKLLLESGAVSAFSVALESHATDEQIQTYTTLFMNFMSGEV